jgi:hypothetical protein
VFKPDPRHQGVFKYQKLDLWAVFWNTKEERLAHLYRFAAERADVREPEKYSAYILIKQMMRHSDEFTQDFLESLAFGF